MSSIIVVGGGFFGMYLAEYFAKSGHSVKLIEREQGFMTRASYNNQARVHNGYHYPRSILTALRSRIAFPRFVSEFEDCIQSELDKYYLIGKPLGKISAKQFQKFCDKIGAPCEPAPYHIQHLTNPNLIDASFSVKEYAFDAVKLKDIMVERLSAAKVQCYLGCKVDKVTETDKGLLVSVTNIEASTSENFIADHVFNCTYSQINTILNNSSIDIIPLKHEMTEMCLVDVPDELKNIGITVMCGPFFSVMPFPSTGLHSFSHVRYTPHYEWQDKSNNGCDDAYEKFERFTRTSAWRYMQKDAARYLPILNECKYDRSLWEVKTILPRSESDDSRPILFRANHQINGFHCIMGGKIDNVYDAVETISSLKLLN
ncbi:FAD-dependent oxidoreductase [Aeromonas hydrophila]|uniref:FAD-dependent oxidoreductase n=1 Tax=Aeromonas hydrophila TaxID=644 RepID=UPI002F3F7B27